MVGRNIKKHRKEKGLTLKEVAERIGLTEATVQKYEAGNIKKIDVEMLGRISDALGVLPGTIVGWDKEDYNSLGESEQRAKEEKIIKMYSQLTFGHKKAVQNLMESLLECQDRYMSDK